MGISRLDMEDMTKNKAKIQSDAQRTYDKAHHEGRLKWLSGDGPKWVCGTPLLPHEIIQMRTASEDALILINDHGMVLNHAA